MSQGFGAFVKNGIRLLNPMGWSLSLHNRDGQKAKRVNKTKLPAWAQRLINTLDTEDTDELAGSTKHGRQRRKARGADAKRRKKRKMAKASRKKNRR